MNGEGFPQQPPQNPNFPPHQPDVMPQHGPHMSGTEFGGSPAADPRSAESHLMEAPGTEVMRLSPNSDLIGYDPVSPAERTERALGALRVGESTIVWKPGEGNRRVTLVGGENGRLIYDWEDPAPPPPARQAPQPPARHATALPPSHVGPIGGVDFGPQGLQPPQEAAPYAQPPRIDPRGKKPPEGHPDAAPEYERTYVDANDDLSDVDDAFARPLVSRRTPQREPQPEPRQPQPVVEAGVPPVERLNPKTIQDQGVDEDFSKESVLVHRPGDRRAYPRPQPNPEGDYGQSQDLVDRIKRGEAEPVAEMSDEDRPDMTAVRKPGAKAGAVAAAEHAERIGAAEQPSDDQAEQQRPAADDEEAPQELGDLIPNVVPEGQEPDFDPGGGPPRYR